MNRTYRALIILTALLFVLPLSLNAATKTVSGKITSADPGGTVGATVTVGVGTASGLAVGGLGWVTASDGSPMAYVKIVTAERNSSTAVVTKHTYTVEKVRAGLTVSFPVEERMPEAFGAAGGPAPKKEAPPEKGKTKMKDIFEPWGRIAATYKDVTPEMAGYYGLTEESGAVVDTVEAGSQAEKDGLLKEDLITTFAGKKIISADQLNDLEVNTEPGKKVTVTVIREGTKKDLILEVGSMPEWGKWILRGKDFVEIGEYEKAVGSLTKAVELNPDKPNGYVLRAIAYLKLKKYDSALTDFTRTIDLDPKAAVAYVGRGGVYDGLGDYNKSIDDYTRAIDLDPKDAVAYNNRGVAYAYLGEYDNAVADLTGAIELDPKNPKSYCNRGGVYNSLGDYNKAIDDYTRAMDLGLRDANTYCGRGICYAILGESDKAIDDTTRAIELDPNFAQAYSFRGIALGQLKRHEEAKRDLKRACDLGDKSSCEVLKMLK